MVNNKISISIAGASTFNLKSILISLKLKKINITVYDGPNRCAWNGGRINRDINITKKDIGDYNKLGVRVSLTFTNPVIDLKDKTGLKLLELLSFNKNKNNNSKTINEIILVNDDFRIFLRDNYNFILKYSITGHKNYTSFLSREEIKEYYKDLFSKYDKVVIHSELAPKRWFIEFLHEYNYLIKAEVIINIIKGCSFCPKYKEHYELIASDSNNPKVMYCILDDVPKDLVNQFYNPRTKKLLIEIYNIKFEGRSGTEKEFLKHSQFFNTIKDIL